MAEVVNMPRLSDTMEEGTVAQWHKNVGDKVEEGDLLAEIETDKATMEFEAFQEGILLHIGVEEGNTAPVDTILAILGEEGEDISALLGAGSSAASADTEPKEEETTEDHIVVGHVSDYFDHPMPYMEVVAKVDGLRYGGITDKDGIYKIPLVGLELKDGEEKEVVILAKLNYIRDGTNYFDIEFRKPNGRYELVQAFKKGTLVEGEHLQIDFRMDSEGDFVANFDNKENLKHYSLNYFHTAEAVEFTLETLKETLDYKLPINVYVGNPHKNTLYSPTNSDILISADDASLSDSDRPDNREYHEFMHAVMYDIYGTWPEGGKLPGTVNHDGYLNPSTADSYIEGFAEFMAMVVSDEMGEHSPQLYAGFGSMDQNYKMWDGQGFDEEFAIASLLWDMYDDSNEKGDEITLSIEEIWKVLKVKRKDFYEYYKAFKSEFPKKSDAIDKLFILHHQFHHSSGKANPYIFFQVCH